MSIELAKREVVKNRYIALCYVAFLLIIIFPTHNRETFSYQLAAGFFGGSLFSHLIFCCRHRQPYFFLSFESWKVLESIPILIFLLSLIAAALWSVAKGDAPIVVTGVLVAQALFQITYESWWDEKQKSDLKADIRREIESQLDTKFDDLRNELEASK
jgi:hypothetical protein